jgi:hypothetical protein
MLRTAFFALKRDAAPGSDGLTWRTYDAHSGEGDRPFRPKLITDSGDRDHADHGRERPA